MKWEKINEEWACFDEHTSKFDAYKNGITQVLAELTRINNAFTESQGDTKSEKAMLDLYNEVGKLSKSFKKAETKITQRMKI
jgi:hypothetical protein